jgi:flap endonuclease-1
MGVDLGDLAVKKTIALENLAGRTIAVDAFNTIYQFLSSIRQEDGNPLMDFKGRITAHLSGLFYRNARLLENGIRPVFVFDGEPPEFKKKTQEARREARREAEEKWKTALAEERMEDARKYARASVRLTTEMVNESKQLLTAMGIPIVQAPSEGEAQAARMVADGAVYAAASQDYDALLFGAEVLVRNISITGRRKVPKQDRYVLVEPEEIRLGETLRTLDLSRGQLVMLGLLVGTDFNEGIHGIGPKKGLKIVQEVKTLTDLRTYVKAKHNAEFMEDIEEIYHFFMSPPNEKVEVPRQKEPDPEAVKKILVSDHDFDQQRVDNVLANIQKQMKEKGAQRKMDEWF